MMHKFHVSTTKWGKYQNCKMEEQFRESFLYKFFDWLHTVFDSGVSEVSSLHFLKQ